MASLSTCHLELVVWDGNLVKILKVQTGKRVPTSEGRIYKSVLYMVNENSTYYDDLGYFAANLITTTYIVDLNTHNTTILTY